VKGGNSHDAIGHHMALQGRFVFDTRNPLVADWRTWTPDESRRVVRHPDFGAVEAWNDVAQDAATGVVTYWTHYRVQATGKHLSAESKIAFPSKAELERQIADAGLQVEQWFGDWHGATYGDAMPEIIPVGMAV
jgi:hypothetical protein